MRYVLRLGRWPISAPGCRRRLGLLMARVGLRTDSTSRRTRTPTVNWCTRRLACWLPRPRAVRGLRWPTGQRGRRPGLSIPRIGRTDAHVVVVPAGSCTALVVHPSVYAVNPLPREVLLTLTGCPERRAGAHERLPGNACVKITFGDAGTRSFSPKVVPRRVGAPGGCARIGRRPAFGGSPYSRWRRLSWADG
jgi:hypothetical protein